MPVKITRTKKIVEKELTSEEKIEVQEKTIQDLNKQIKDMSEEKEKTVIELNGKIDEINIALANILGGKTS